MRGRKRRYRELTWDQPDDEVGPSFRRKRRRPPWLLIILVVAAVAVLVVLRSRLAPGIRQFSIVARPTATPTVTSVATPSLRPATPFAQVAISHTLPASQWATSGLPLPIGPVTQPVTITFWEQESDEGAALLDELAAGFTAANPQVRVQRIHYLSSAQMREEFTALALAGHGPDLLRGANDLTTPLVDAGTIRPAGALYDGATLAQFFPGALSAAVISDTVWALPDNYGSHLMLLYNQKLVKDVPVDTRAWIDQLKTLTDEANGQYGLVYNLNEPYWLIPWIGGFGGWPLDQNDRPDLYNQAVIDALQFVHNLKSVHQVVPASATYDSASALFKAGKAAYIIDGQWSLADYRASGIDLGIASMPRVAETGGYPVPLTAGKYWFVNTNTTGSHLEATRRFVAFMTSADSQQKWLEKLGRLPSSRAAAQSEFIQKDPMLSAETLQLGRGRGLPPAPAMLCVLQAMRPGLENVMSGTVSPTDGALKMQQDADGCLSATP